MDLDFIIILTKLKQVLEELTLFMLSMDNEIITCNSAKSDDVKDIEKAIEKLKLQEKKISRFIFKF